MSVSTGVQAMNNEALIVGAGPGLSASFARVLAREGYRVSLAARNTGKLAALAQDIGASVHTCDVSNVDAVAGLFAVVGQPSVVLFNASARVRGPVVDIDPAAVHRALEISAFGGFLVGQQAARAMLAIGGGTILLTGASASVKGFPNSSSFAMGKFALRGLAQSMARELHPQGVHVVHVVVDGGIRSAERVDPTPDSLLDPDGIAETMLALVKQPRSVWTDEIAVRPWVEKF
jgi:NAD(P)-dependent dehydrogenase (short-subunit alcohol dehydrogenase family)